MDLMISDFTGDFAEMAISLVSDNGGFKVILPFIGDYIDPNGTVKYKKQSDDNENILSQEGKEAELPEKIEADMRIKYLEDSSLLVEVSPAFQWNCNAAFEQYCVTDDLVEHSVNDNFRETNFRSVSGMLDGLRFTMKKLLKKYVVTELVIFTTDDREGKFMQHYQSIAEIFNDSDSQVKTMRLVEMTKTGFALAKDLGCRRVSINCADVPFTLLDSSSFEIELSLPHLSSFEPIQKALVEWQAGMRNFANEVKIEYADGDVTTEENVQVLPGLKRWSNTADGFSVFQLTRELDDAVISFFYNKRQTTHHFRIKPEISCDSWEVIHIN